MSIQRDREPSSSRVPLRRGYRYPLGWPASSSSPMERGIMGAESVGHCISSGFTTPTDARLMLVAASCPSLLGYEQGSLAGVIN